MKSVIICTFTNILNLKLCVERRCSKMVRHQEETPNCSLLEFTKTYLNYLILETKGTIGKRAPKNSNASGLKTEDEMRWKIL